MKSMQMLVFGFLLMSFGFAPAALAQKPDVNPLAGTSWELDSYGVPGSEVTAVAGSTTLNFLEDGQVGGSGGCNNYGGSYTAGENTIAFSQIISTLRACADNAVTRQEQAYFEALGSASSYAVSGSSLAMWYEGGKRLNFVSVDGIGTQEPAYENQNSPVELLASYYNAINRGEYQRAYSYWQVPPNPYDEFVSGFSDTIHVQLIVQPPTRIEGAAGSLYAAIPTVLIADHVDGSQHTYAGCFVTRKSNLHPPDIPEADVWHLYDAALEEVTTDPVDVPLLLSEACETF